MFRSGRTALLLLCAVLVTACERTPVEPLDDADDFALALVGPTPLGVRPAPLTLPGLLHTAIHTVYTERGPDEARALVRELTGLQTDARAAASAGSAETATALLRRAHEERLRLVLAVLGDGAAAEVLSQARAAERELHGSVGRMAPDARGARQVTDLLAQAAELLADATAGLDDGDMRTALDHATRAAALLEGARLTLSEASRVPGLDEIYRAAAGRLAENEAGVRALAEHNRLQLLAEKAALRGDRVRAQELLDQARGEQIRVVLTVFGADAGRGMIEQARAAAADVSTALRSARTNGRDLSRLERMYAASRDMLMRADAALARGDARTALDLGGHAVSLLNALRLALAGQ